MLLPDDMDLFPGISLSAHFMHRCAKKVFYKHMVKTLNQSRLSGHSNTPWRMYLRLASDVSPGDHSTNLHQEKSLQRILHGSAVAVNSFLCVIAAAEKDKCPFFKERLSSTVSLTVLTPFTFLRFCGETFSKQFFICGVKYTRREKNKWWDMSRCSVCEQKEKSGGHAGHRLDQCLHQWSES